MAALIKRPMAVDLPRHNPHKPRTMTTPVRKKPDNRAALPLVAPFVIVYAALFLYPTLQMLAMSLTDGQLILPGEWGGSATT